MNCEEANKVNLKNSATIFSFEQQSDNINHDARTPFHLHANSLIDYRNAAETAIQIIAAKKPVTSPALAAIYMKKKIGKKVADTYCYEVQFKITDKDEEYVAIGFKNNAGGYELRCESLSLHSFPNYVTYFNNPKIKNDKKISISNANIEHENVSQNHVDRNEKHVDILNENSKQNQQSKNRKSIAVFEDFFDFLSFQTIHQNPKQPLTNFLVLNTLDLFERSLLLMEKHNQIHLYLKHDNDSRKYVQLALKRSASYIDESSLYKDYGNLNKWLMQIGTLQKVQHLDKSEKIGLPYHF